MPDRAPEGPMTEGQSPWFRMGRRFFREGGAGASPRLFDFAKGAEIDPDAAKAWLSMGYVPGDRTIFRGVECLPGGCTFRVSEGKCTTVVPDRLQRLESGSPGIDVLFDAAVDAELAKGGRPVVPLSGGLDSRILLGALLDRLPPRSVTTVTYGVPGTLDYELGNAVARRAGTQHHPMDLSLKHPWRRDELETVARLSDANNSLFCPTVWLKMLDFLGGDGRVWTGYTGDGIGGAFAQRVRGGQAKPLEAFLGFELGTLPGWVGKLPATSSTLKGLCATRSPMDDLLSPTEAVWYANHVERYTTHHVFVHGVDYATPFMDLDVVRFFAGLSESEREGKVHFNRWASQRWKRLFELPTKDYGWGLSTSTTPLRRGVWRGRDLASKALYRLFPGRFVHPNVSYRHFQQELRDAGTLRTLVRDLLHDLDREGIWSESDWGVLWDAQRAGGRFAPVLLNGASLGVVAGMLKGSR